MARPIMNYGFDVECRNCDWKGQTHFGSGGRAEAWNEYREHKKECNSVEGE